MRLGAGNEACSLMKKNKFYSALMPCSFASGFQSIGKRETWFCVENKWWVLNLLVIQPVRLCGDRAVDWNMLLGLADMLCAIRDKGCRFDMPAILFKHHKTILIKPFTDSLLEWSKTWMPESDLELQALVWSHLAVSTCL